MSKSINKELRISSDERYEEGSNEKQIKIKYYDSVFLMNKLLIRWQLSKIYL